MKIENQKDFNIHEVLNQINEINNKQEELRREKKRQLKNYFLNGLL